MINFHFTQNQSIQPWLVGNDEESLQYLGAAYRTQTVLNDCPTESRVYEFYIDKRWGRNGAQQPCRVGRVWSNQDISKRG